MSVAVRRALRGKMGGDSTLTNLLGAPPTGFSQSIYYESAPEGAHFPYVLFSKSSGTPTYTFKTGHAALDNEMWFIKGVDRSTDSDPVDAISSRLDALLTDGAVTISGATQLYLRRESDVDYAEVTDGVQYLHSGALFRLIYE